MGFKGWPASAMEFYEGLEADNSKTYWNDYKTVYERDVKAPMTELLAELAAEFGEGRMFRPYRDIRFSADKSPYKTSIAAGVGEYGYVQLTSEGLMAGAGMYHLMPDQLTKYRAAVAADKTGAQLVDTIARVRKQKVDVHGTDPLKTAPKGYDKDHPRIDLLRNKGLVVVKQWPVAAWLGTAAAKGKIADLLRAARPVIDWLDTNVGPSATEAPRR